jgi:hypothetical protein
LQVDNRILISNSCVCYSRPYISVAMAYSYFDDG